MVRIIRWAHLFSKDVLSALERKEVRYSVGPLNFLESDLLTFSLSPPLPLPPTSASSAISNGEFSADLVVGLVPLPNLASSAPSIDDGKFSADRVGVVLSIEVSAPANLLKP